MKYACFISFPRGVPTAERLAKELAEALRDALNIFHKDADVFCCAEKERNTERIGTHWEDWIPKALCHSATMVAICPPAYFTSSPGCVREFLSMQAIVGKRRNALPTAAHPQHYIHALQLVEDYAIEELSTTAVHDFSEYPSQTVALERTVRGRKKVNNIASQVHTTWQLLRDQDNTATVVTACDCAQFALVPLPAKYQRSSEAFPSFGGVRS